MPLPHQTAVQAAIKMFQNKKNPTIADLHHVKVVAQVQEQLIEYEARSKGMTAQQLIAEKHDPGLMAKFMSAIGDPRPHELCHCHAIISGSHPNAAPLRAVMGLVKVKIDLPANGSWLPKNTAAVTQMPKHLKRAVPHSRIHRTGYYLWLASFINIDLITDERTLKQALKKARFHLETSSFPSYVMLPARLLR